MKALIFVLALLTLSAGTAAYDLSDYNVVFSFHEDYIIENTTLKFGPDSGPIEYMIPHPADRVIYFYWPDAVPVPGEDSVIIMDNNTAGKHARITLQRKDKKTSEYNIFTHSINHKAKMLNVTFRLGQEYTLAEKIPAIYPKPNEIVADGNEIWITWQFRNVSEEIRFLVLYSGGESNHTLLLVILALVATLIGGGTVFLTKYKAKEIMVGTLDRNEKAVVMLLSEDKNLTQKQLVRKTGFSKSKMSKVVRKLEEKGVLTKEPYMNTNKLHMKKEFKHTEK